MVKLKRKTKQKKKKQKRQYQTRVLFGKACSVRAYQYKAIFRLSLKRHPDCSCKYTKHFDRPRPQPGLKEGAMMTG